MNKILVLIGESIIMCLINAGILYIDDRLKRIISSNIVHIVRLGLYLFCGTFFVLTRAGYSIWGKYILIECVVILIISIVEYYEEIYSGILTEMAILAFIVLLGMFVNVTWNINAEQLVNILLAGLIFGFVIILAFLIANVLIVKKVEFVEIKFVLSMVCIIVGNGIIDFIFGKKYFAIETDKLRLFNDISVVLIIIIFIIEIIGHAFVMYYKNVDERFKALEYANEQYDVDRIQQMYEESRKIRHDLKQCISSVKGYIETGKYEEAVNLLNEISDSRIDGINYRKYCDNKVVNYVLNDKYSKCRNYNIDFKCMVLGIIRGIDDIDLCILLGNIIDNAIEAAQKTDDGYVNIEITVRGTIFINVENSIKESFLKKKDAFVSTKADKRNHGIGTKSIHDIVNKYSGEVEYKEHGNSIICKVVLPEKE